jgi:hypothetical protein
MKKTFIIFVLIFFVGLQVYSEDKIIHIYIDQVSVNSDMNPIQAEDDIYIPMISYFNTLGAQVNKGDIITSYYLNTYVKADPANKVVYINGKGFNFEPLYRDNELYVPLDIFLKAFDLTVGNLIDDTLYLNANTVIQYRNYNAIQYKQISFKDEGVRFSIPLDWDYLRDQVYGYDSNYGRISVEFSSRILNENIDVNTIIEMYKEHLFMAYLEYADITNSTTELINYLTSNVLYIETDVNAVNMKRVVYFINTDEYVYTIEFNYPGSLSERYFSEVIGNIMNSFYIDSVTFDKNNEHYIETPTVIETGMMLSSELYSNMIVEDSFILEGYFNTTESIQSLTVQVRRDDKKLDLYIPVENNAFKAKIYTPFGLGKHDFSIAISAEEEKVIFDPDTHKAIITSNDQPLMNFSVVNISDQVIRYSIPTKNVQSDDNYIASMSNLISYRYSTNYSRAKALYDFVEEEVLVLEINPIKYTALDVYEAFEGTKKEIAYYLTALLRAQKIPARIVEGDSDFSTHLWVEAFLNGSWLILDPVGDSQYIEIIVDESYEPLEASFNGKRSIYNNRYPTQTVLDY